MKLPIRTFVALGANMPFKDVSGARLLSDAVLAMEAEGLGLQAISGVWQTEAWPPGSAQPDYYNAVVELDGAALEPEPEPLYAVLARIEYAFGRERREQWAPRTLDLDIVAMDGFVGRYGSIILPHVRMAERRFVLAPLAEIAPDWRHPVLDRSVSELLASAPVSRITRVGDMHAVIVP